jgi:hypothetical protein
MGPGRRVALNPATLELRLIAKSRRRQRRPTEAELEALDAHFELRDKRSDIPMFDIWHFAIASTRREGEICRLLWKDNDPQNADPRARSGGWKWRSPDKRNSFA